MGGKSDDSSDSKTLTKIVRCLVADPTALSKSSIPGHLPEINSFGAEYIRILHETYPNPVIVHFASDYHDAALLYQRFHSSEQVHIKGTGSTGYALVILAAQERLLMRNAKEWNTQVPLQPLVYIRKQGEKETGSITTLSHDQVFSGLREAIMFEIKRTSFDLEQWQQKELPKSLYRILVVDDDAAVTSLLSDVLEEEGHVVNTATNGIDGLALFRKEKYDLVITGHSMPKMTGNELAVKLRVTSPYLPIIATSASHESLVNTQLFGAVLSKPFDIYNLIRTVYDVVSASGRNTEAHVI